MDSPFAAALVRLREQAGFKTPHAFFKGAGGRQLLRISFVTYWNMEKGRHLPKPERLSLLASCLRLPPGSGAAEELVRAYLRSLLGSEKAYDYVMGTLGSRAGESPQTMEERATQRLLISETHQLSYEQDQVIRADYASYWGWCLLCNDTEAWTTADLAKRVGVKPAAMAKALRGLARANLVELLPGAKARCPLAGRHLRKPPASSRPRRENERLWDFQDKMAKSRGSLVKRASVLIRAATMDVEHYYPALAKAVGNVHVYSKHQRRPGEPPAPFYMVEGRIVRLEL